MSGGQIVRRCLRHGTLSPGRCPRCEREHNAKRTEARARSASLHSGAARALRAEVLARDGYLCRWCGGQATEIDYLVPLSLGGERVAANAVAACRRCNARRGGALGAALRGARQERPREGAASSGTCAPSGARGI